MKSFKKQKGVIIADVMAALGMVAVLTTSAFNFFNVAISNAQAITAMTTTKLVFDQVATQFAQGVLPCTEAENATFGVFSFSGTNINTSYIESATWYPACTNQKLANGHISVVFKNTEPTANALRGKEVIFYWQTANFNSSLIYQGCLTNISQTLDGSEPVDNSMSLNINTCRYASKLDIFTGANSINAETTFPKTP